MTGLTRAGLSLFAIFALLAVLAPCLAGGEPLLVVSSWGIQMPALRDALAPLPRAGPRAPVEQPPPGAWILGTLVPHDPLAVDLAARLTPPGRAHWLGTDEVGRDVLARLIHASRPSLLVAGLATALSLVLGIPIGAAAGYTGGRADLLLSRLIEATLSIPALVLLLLMSTLALPPPSGAAGPPGTPGAARSVLVVGLAVGLVRWAVIGRYMRGEVLRLSRTDLALAARACGAAPLRILWRHLVPAGMAPVTVSAAFGAGTAVAAEASLSYLGIGVQPPAPTWGQMIASAASGPGAWWLLVFPGAMIALTVASFNMVGEGLRRSLKSAE